MLQQLQARRRSSTVAGDIYKQGASRSSISSQETFYDEMPQKFSKPSHYEPLVAQEAPEKVLACAPLSDSQALIEQQQLQYIRTSPVLQRIRKQRDRFIERQMPFISQRFQESLDSCSVLSALPYQSNSTQQYQQGESATTPSMLSSKNSPAHTVQPTVHRRLISLKQQFNLQSSSSGSNNNNKQAIYEAIQRKYQTETGNLENKLEVQKLAALQVEANPYKQLAQKQGFDQQSNQDLVEGEENSESIYDQIQNKFNRGSFRSRANSSSKRSTPGTTMAQVQGQQKFLTQIAYRRATSNYSTQQEADGDEGHGEKFTRQPQEEEEEDESSDALKNQKYCTQQTGQFFLSRGNTAQQQSDTSTVQGTQVPIVYVMPLPAAPQIVQATIPTITENLDENLQDSIRNSLRNMSNAKRGSYQAEADTGNTSPFITQQGSETLRKQPVPLQRGEIDQKQQILSTSRSVQASGTISSRKALPRDASSQCDLIDTHFQQQQNLNTQLLEKCIELARESTRQQLSVKQAYDRQLAQEEKQNEFLQSGCQTSRIASEVQQLIVGRESAVKPQSIQQDSQQSSSIIGQNEQQTGKPNKKTPNLTSVFLQTISISPNSPKQLTREESSLTQTQAPKIAVQNDDEDDGGQNNYNDDDEDNSQKKLAEKVNSNQSQEVLRRKMAKEALQIAYKYSNFNTQKISSCQSAKNSRPIVTENDHPYNTISQEQTRYHEMLCEKISEPRNPYQQQFYKESSSQQPFPRGNLQHLKNLLPQENQYYGQGNKIIASNNIKTEPSEYKTYTQVFARAGQNVIAGEQRIMPESGLIFQQSQHSRHSSIERGASLPNRQELHAKSLRERTKTSSSSSSSSYSCSASQQQQQQNGIYQQGPSAYRQVPQLFYAGQLYAQRRKSLKGGSVGSGSENQCHMPTRNQNSRTHSTLESYMQAPVVN